ncbi:MAG: DNA repair protein RecO [Pseudomonadota bacterium]
MSRVELQPAFVLHQRRYRETSLIIDVVTPDFGRVGLIAKGARGSKKNLAAQLQTFRQLLLSWSGRSELRTLTTVEEVPSSGSKPPLHGEALYCAYYINELVLYLLPRDDSQVQAFATYSQTLSALAEADCDYEAVLRLFELNLLDSLGYKVELEHDVASASPIRKDQSYSFRVDSGPVARTFETDQELTVSGKTLLDLSTEDLSDPETRVESKKLLRGIVDYHLDNRPLKSRKMFKDMFGNGGRGS